MWADEEDRSALITEGGAKIGRFADCSARYKEQLATAGFTNIEQTIYKWPQNRWPKDKKYKELGKLTRKNCLNRHGRGTNMKYRYVGSRGFGPWIGGPQHGDFHACFGLDERRDGCFLG